MREKVIQCILDKKIIAIVRGMEEQVILPLAEAFLAGGVGMMEVTFNQSRPDSFEATAKSIAALRSAFGERMLAGAGTVITTAQLELAKKAGALYIVSPNADPEIIKRTRELGLVSLPGATTPSECVVAHNAGADFIKLFPASDLGSNYLKAIKAPLSHIRFLAVGGVNEKNIAEFLRAGADGAGVGGNLVNKEWIAAGEFDKITETAKALVRAAMI